MTQTPEFRPRDGRGHRRVSLTPFPGHGEWNIPATWPSPGGVDGWLHEAAPRDFADRLVFALQHPPRLSLIWRDGLDGIGMGLNIIVAVGRMHPHGAGRVMVQAEPLFRAP